MIDVDLPQTEGIPEIVRSFAACVASVTETPLSDVPQPRADLCGAIAHWRSWLAGRGAGLVPIANPTRFNWPGYWLAVLGDKDAAIAYLNAAYRERSACIPDLKTDPRLDSLRSDPRFQALVRNAGFPP